MFRAKLSQINLEIFRLELLKEELVKKERLEGAHRFLLKGQCNLKWNTKDKCYICHECRLHFHLNPKNLVWIEVETNSDIKEGYYTLL